MVATSYYFDPANDNSIHVFLQDEDGSLVKSWVRAVGGTPDTVQVGDVNGDHRDDVVVGNGLAIVVFTQNDAGTLDPAVTYPTSNSYKVAIGDLNGDGRLDVVGIDWGSSGHDVEVFLQGLTGALVPSATYTVDHGGYDDLDVGDVSGDGRDDVVVMSGQLYAHDNLTGDGLRDVVVLHGGWLRLGVFEQQPGGGLGPEQLFEVPYASHYNPHGLAAGDLNGDGATDGRHDPAVYEGSTGRWNIWLSSTGALSSFWWGGLTFQAVGGGDYDGDGATELVLHQQTTGLWFIYLTTTRQVVSGRFGGSGYAPVE